MRTLINYRQAMETYRAKRAFDPAVYVKQKTEAILDFMLKHNLMDVVVGVSGGIDSAVVYALLCEAAKLEPVFFSVHPVFIPIKSSIGTTGQDDAAEKVSLLKVDSLVSNSIQHITGIGEISNTIMQQINGSLNIPYGMPDGQHSHNPEFVKGQLDYNLRPAILYAVVAHIQSNFGFPVLCGTINRDEGSYIGYFGKKTDTCDIQIIGDLHKSEVYQVAKYLGIHEDIINAAPAGGLYTGNTDEQEIGAPYDFIEVYPYLKSNNMTVLLDDESKTYMYRLEDRHARNSHKYLRPLDCTFIDVIERTWPNNIGWK